MVSMHVRHGDQLPGHGAGVADQADRAACDQVQRLLQQNVDVRQPIDQPVDLAVRGVDLALVEGLVRGDGRGRELPVQGQHALHQPDHALVAGRVRRVVEVDGADGPTPIRTTTPLTLDRR